MRPNAWIRLAASVLLHLASPSTSSQTSRNTLSISNLDPLQIASKPYSTVSMTGLKKKSISEIQTFVAAASSNLALSSSDKPFSSAF